MLILLALVIGAATGGAVHLAVPARATRGTALGPLSSAALAGAVWSALTWLGFAEDNPWIWSASIVIPPAATAVLLIVLARSRSERDTRERARLGLA